MDRREAHRRGGRRGQSRRPGERAPDGGRADRRHRRPRDEHRQRARRGRGREGQPVPARLRPRHQHPDRHRVERFVEEDHEKRPDAGDASVAVAVGDTGGQGDAVQQAVQKQAQGRPAPRHVMMRSFVGMMMMMIAAGMIEGMVVIFTGHVVVMVAKESLDEEHREEAAEHPIHRGRDGLVERRALGEHGVGNRVGQHVQQADPQHQAGHETDGELHTPMRQPEPDRDHPAGNRRQQDEHAIIDHAGELAG